VYYCARAPYYYGSSSTLGF
nr:immunoglobulin heavy chain junction region [Mus musculus]